ncbi:MULTISPECIES: glycosyltransferase family 1 protein [unclassified Pseudodesulfovibrio]|uniref:glycosyltransferase family 1 protein n=1 Tax=unclassified Pseudodesulfovibrio TaxID=2661612 RepID=UPI000FEBFBBF|nr:MULTISPECIES: glycosyltransferase family 1 protein [unclassified Pseudodesulfovibrio]MCJ2166134.1 glycosyltransferase family 1 protein [Pseudodesulfovibrio sp. S3-i]RWU02427.1 glycosyltransferase family 1 protein [Pseudodesulfovibrio sp. S3]
MKTFIFLPPVSRPTGGITVLRQMADILHQSGRDVFLVAREKGGWRPAGMADSAPVMEWVDLKLTKADIWVVPEGWVNALAPGLYANAQCFSYIQNWAYIFSSLPEEVDWHSLPVEFLAVSDPVSLFIKEATFKDSPILRPGIDRSVYFKPENKPDGKLNVAYMPRKNKALAEQIKAIFEHRCGYGEVNWLPIAGMDAREVAETLRSAHVFLATGFPEGCPLPPLEAMACGCLPVGFTGFGGWDYMRQLQETPRYTPWIELREVDWSGNGLWCADGDVLDAALCLEDAVRMIRDDESSLAAALDAGQQTADAYSTEEQRFAVQTMWDAL